MNVRSSGPINLSQRAFQRRTIGRTQSMGAVVRDIRRADNLVTGKIGPAIGVEVVDGGPSEVSS
jgi:hypothetical protein